MPCSVLLWVVVLLFANCDSFVTRQDQNGNSAAEETCRCVPNNLCADNDAAVNGDGLLDVRFRDGECQNYFEICCENPIAEIANVPDQPIYKGCGYQNPTEIVTRILSNSQKALFGELPWTVIILQRDVSRTERNMYKCGGSLIHPQVVVTAAHCVIGLDQDHLTIRAGEWNTKSTDEPLPHQDHAVGDIVVHPHFHSGSLRNDIALVFLTHNVILTDNVGIVCLPPPNLKMDTAICTASGWGRDAFNKGKHSSVLKKVDLPLVEREKCLGALRKTRLGSFYNLHRSFICAGGEQNKDTCKGDGGSPLVCPIPGKEDRFFQIGIVSWGIGCGDDETPGVYVNVPLFTLWIDKQLSDKKLDTYAYKY